MAFKTEQIEKVCKDLVEILIQQLPDQAPELVTFIGQQYFMGTLSRLVSLAKLMAAQAGEVPDLNRQDLHFALTYPADADLAQIEIIRKEAALLLAKCFDTLKENLN